MDIIINIGLIVLIIILAGIFIYFNCPRTAKVVCRDISVLIKYKPMSLNKHKDNKRIIEEREFIIKGYSKGDDTWVCDCPEWMELLFSGEDILLFIQNESEMQKIRFSNPKLYEVLRNFEVID